MIDLAVKLRDLRPAGPSNRALPRALTVVVADEAPTVRGELRLALSAAEISVVAEAADGPAAARAALRHRPEVLVLDQCMGGPGGIAAIVEVRRGLPETAVLAFSAAEDEDSVLAAMRAGAHGYLLKGAAPEDIVRAVRGVAAGEAIFCHNVAHRVLSLIARPPATPLANLTAREREILQLVSAGLDNAHIARRLRLAPKTVRNHLCAIQAKLDGRPGPRAPRTQVTRTSAG